jgi:methyl-accepting chemotaxis protein
MQEDTFRWVITGAVLIATLCIFLMAAVSFVLYRVIAQMKIKVDGVIAKAEPIMDTVRKVADENAPKISVLGTRAVEIAANAKEISDVAKDQAHRFAEVGRDLADRAKAQIARVDNVVDETVSQAHVVGSGVKDAVMKPVREASGLMAGIKAAVNTLAASRRPTVDHITQDEEMFI